MTLKGLYRLTILSFYLFFGVAAISGPGLIRGFVEMGGPGIVVFYPMIFWLLGRMQTDVAATRLIWASPFLLVLLQAATIFAYATYSGFQNIALYLDYVGTGLMFGYSYVLWSELFRVFYWQPGRKVAFAVAIGGIIAVSLWILWQL
jgi:hypothetical protein